jgi:hypothetical protein
MGSSFTRSAATNLVIFSLVGGALLLFFATAASAALIDITVVGIWESANVSPIYNKFGLVGGDRFVMRATYDDTTLFDGSEGVTATIDPAVNPGTSFNVIIPHLAGGPNPLLFDHSDHTDIGFAPFVQIEFDGPNAGSPGNFRNFEIHVDFSFAGDLHDFDTFMGAVQTESDLYNESQGFNLAGVGTGAEHLVVVVNDVTSNAGGPYVFDASNLSLNTGGASGGGSGFLKVFDWTGPGGVLANSPGAAISFVLSESGLVDTTDISSISLAVTEFYTDFTSSSDNASVSYANAPPAVSSASGTGQPDFSIDFAASLSDSDFAANALVPGFENVTLEFLYNSSVFLVGSGNLDIATLLGIFGGVGVFSVEARATDLAGATDSLAVNVSVIQCNVQEDCDDGAFCNGSETCFANACLSGSGDPCLGNSSPFCDESHDQRVDCLKDGDCDDGAFCTGAETCVAGLCSSPGDPCTSPTPFCDEVVDTCSACLTALDCSSGEVCSVGICGPVVPAASPELRVLLVVAILSIALAALGFSRRSSS